MSKLLIGLGVILIVVGLCWPWLRKLGIGNLPGDIMFKRGDFTFYFPIVTCLVISLLLTVIFWFFNR